jgi:hypothetical protein
MDVLSAEGLRQYWAADFQREMRKRGQPPKPVYLPPSLYSEAERRGYDMSGYERQLPMPAGPR